jgi:hypothetical protein
MEPPDFTPGGCLSALQLTTRFAIHHGTLSEFMDLTRGRAGRARPGEAHPTHVRIRISLQVLLSCLAGPAVGIPC